MFPTDERYGRVRKPDREEETVKLYEKRQMPINTIDGGLDVETRILVPKFNYKTVVVLCAPEFRREDLVSRIIRKKRPKFECPIRDITGDHADVENLDVIKFNRVTREQMLLDMQTDKYVETMTYNNEIYGLQLDSIRAIHAQNKIAILEIQPKTLFALRNSEFAPYAIFIDPPSFFPDCDVNGFMARIHKQSEEIKRDLSHLINKVIALYGMVNTLEKLYSIIEEAFTLPQWVPESWISEP